MNNPAPKVTQRLVHAREPVPAHYAKQDELPERIGLCQWACVYETWSGQLLTRPQALARLRAGDTVYYTRWELADE